MEGPVPAHYAPTPQLHDTGVFSTGHPSLVSQPDISLEPFHFDPQLANQPDLGLQGRNVYETGSFETNATQQARFQAIRTGSSAPILQSEAFTQGRQYGGRQRHSRPSQDDSSAGQHLFGALTPHPPLPSQPHSHDEALGRLQGELDLRPQAGGDGATTGGHFGDRKPVPNPPDLDAWRQRLFDIDSTIAMTEDE